MAEFIKSSTEVILHQPSGGDWDVYSQSASIYFINLVMHIKGVDGPKELKLKKYHTKSQGETYFLLSTSPDVDSNNATDDAAILTQDLAEDEYRVCAYAQKVQKNDSISSEYSLIKPATSGYGGYRWQLKSRNADGRHTKVVFDAAKVPTLVSVKCGMWGQDQYGSSCTPFVIEVNGFTAETKRFHTGNYVGEATLNVPLPLNMLVKRDDGLLYTLGGAGAGGGNFVTTDKEQLITGKKTFSKVPQVTTKPSAPNDVATVGYVSGQLNAKAPYDVTLDFKVEDDTDGGWVVYSNMEINLDNGKKLKCIHIDNTQPTSASAPVKAVFKAIPATEVINAAPTEQAPTFFDTYQLQDEEYLGTLTYGHILNSQLQDYSSYKGPFHTNQYGTTCTIKEATQLRITISGLPAAVSKVSLKFDSSYLPKTFKASLSGVGMDVTSNVLTNPSGNTPLELLFDVVKLTGLVTLDTAQTITGLKTFDKLPQSSVEPKADADLITKGYADGHYLPVDTKPHKYDILVKMKHDGTSWVGFSDFSVRLRDGTRLDIKHIENQSATTATKPVKAVFKTVKDLKAPIEAPKQQAATFFDSYKLEAGEFTGTVSFYKAAGKFSPAQIDINPWYVYVGTGNANNYDGIYAVSIDNLDKPLLGVNLKFGDAHNSETYTCLQCGVVFTVDGSALEVAYDGDMSNAFETTIEYPINAQSMIGVVTVDTEQEITALKTFKVLPQSEAVPADDKDLVNKKYVDEKVGAGGGTGGASGNAPTTYNILLKMKNNAAPVAFSKFNVRLRDGTRLDLKYIENGTMSSTTTPLKAVWTVVKDLGSQIAQPQWKAKDFFTSYSLGENEYTGSVSPYKVVGEITPNTSKCIPWLLYASQYSTLSYDGFYGVSIDNLDKPLLGINFKFGDDTAATTYTCEQCGAVFSTSLGSVEVMYSGSMANAANATIELSTKSGIITGYVSISEEETITGLKHFDKLPKSNALAKAHDDLVTKAYLDKVLTPPNDYRVSLFLTPKPDNLTHNGFTRVSFSLSNGLFLVPKYVENGNPDNVESNRIIYEMVNKVPARLNYNTVDSNTMYQHLNKMQDNWVSGAIHYGWALDPNCQKNGTGSDPFSTVRAIVKEAKRTNVMAFSFNKLSYAVASIDGTLGSGSGTNWYAASYEAVLTSNAEDYSSGVLETASLKGNDAFSLKFSGSITSVMYTNKEQTVTAKKSFTVLPQSTALPKDAADFVNKAYVDNAIVPNLTGYEVTIYGKTTKAGTKLGFGKLRLFLENGARLYPRATDYSTTKPANTYQDMRWVWSLDNYTAASVLQADPEPELMDNPTATKYVLKENDFDGKVTYAHKLGKFTISSNDRPMAAETSGMTFTATADTEQPLIRFTITGALPAITKVELTTSSDAATNTAASYRAEVRAIGATKKQVSKDIAVTGQSQLISMEVASAFEPNPYYLDIYTDQLARGVKTFDAIPVIRKDADALGGGVANTPALLGDLAGKLALAMPKKYDILFKTGYTENKRNHGGGVWYYSYTTTLRLSNMKLSIRDPKTLESKELYLKGVIGSANASKGVLSLTKPASYPDASSVQVLDSQYQLQEGEYFATLSAQGGTLKKLFVEASSDDWYTTTTSEDRFPGRGTELACYLTLENCPLVTSWSVANSNSSQFKFRDDAVKVYGATTEGTKAGQSFSGVNWAAVANDVNVEVLDLVSLIASMQARIKALEDAAPKP
ncbi:hypothetical protein [Anaerobiospirillum succiniciproducens]|uniref:hypothetical protein n=1 Tax=Anaerobiospirillum succiniciproducens TaxID=13335 RepID=UPI002942F5E6|nr:hypothetical protein [Anaerobiospirillum succiniciproducens]